MRPKFTPQGAPAERESEPANLPSHEDAPTPAPQESHQDFPNQFCPVCSTKLAPQHCKLVCPCCGYFMSCSEFE